MNRTIVFGGIGASAAFGIGLLALALRSEPASPPASPKDASTLPKFGAGLSVYDSGAEHMQYLVSTHLAPLVLIQDAVDVRAGLAVMTDAGLVPTPIVNVNIATGLLNPNSLTSHVYSIHAIADGYRMLVLDEDAALVQAWIAAHAADAGLTLSDDAGGFAPPIYDDGGVIGFAQ